MTWVKICGVQKHDHATELANVDLDALGINRYEQSSRYVDLTRASELAERIRQVNPDVEVVGVYVNETLRNLREDHAAVDWDVIQLHGDESPEFVRETSDLARVMKAFPVDDDFEAERLGAYDSWAYLLDAYHPERYGGTGETAPWERIRFLTDDYKIVLAGGITPRNVAEAIRTVGPWGIDVCSGVEDAEGYKDLTVVKQLLENVRHRDRNQS